MELRRRTFLRRAGLFMAGIGVSFASTGETRGAQNTSANWITVGVGGDVEELSDALWMVEGPSSTNPYIIELLPGIHLLEGVITIPQHVSLKGAGKGSSIIECTNDWSYLGFSANQTMSGFSIRGTRTSASSARGILRNNGEVRDFRAEDITIYLKGGYGAAIFCNWFSTLQFHGVDIWTTSIGIQATGYIHLTDCRVRLSGDATGTPYYGLTCLSGANTSVRYYVLGGFYGDGYGTTNEPGFGANGYSIVNDETQPAVAFYIPPEHQPLTQTGTRFQLTGVESYVRNEDVFNEIPCNCIRVDGAGIVRLFGGTYQAETPNYQNRSWAVVNENYGSHSTYGTIELYSARVSSIRGTVTSFSQEAVGKLSKLEDGIQLSNYNCSNYFCDASSGPFTVFLPAVWIRGGPPQGTKMRFIKSDTSANPVTIAIADGIATIQGQSAVVLTSQYDKVQFLYGADDDDTWYII